MASTFLQFIPGPRIGYQPPKVVVRQPGCDEHGINHPAKDPTAMQIDPETENRGQQPEGCATGCPEAQHNRKHGRET
jgi:hypothetical protein